MQESQQSLTDRHVALWETITLLRVKHKTPPGLNIICSNESRKDYCNLVKIN